MSYKAILGLMAGCASVALAGPAAAWGDTGHKVTAILAYQRLTPKAKAQVDALLAADTDTLTPKDFPSRATWADKYRTSHRNTANWHFVDIEINNPDIKAACFNFPPLGGTLASAGPANDCVVAKLTQFVAELKAPGTPQAEKLLALKFVMHFAGDLHQPLHASDDMDRGGNCIALSPKVGGSNELHGYWDTGVMGPLGGTPTAIAAKLNKTIKASDEANWKKGTYQSWALETFNLAKSDAYNLPSRPTCAAPGSVNLSQAYQAQAQKDVALQLERAGVRMASVLNDALGG
jgi:S1/P1 Nuclease